MDNYNNQYGSNDRQYQPSYVQDYNQGQQYQPGYVPSYNQGQQYQSGYVQDYNQGQQCQPGYVQDYNQGQQYQPGYDNNNIQSGGSNAYVNIGNGQSNLSNGYAQNISDKATKKGIARIITVSFVLGLVGSIIMFIGLMMPAIDFSHFHSEVDIQYNLFKVGKNVGLISAMWNVIPYAIMISIIIMAILSLVRIPILKLLPSILILCMFVLMLVDMGNVASWATDMLDKVGIVLEKEITTGEIMKSLMPGIYILVAGWFVSLISCFVKTKE